MTIENLFIIFSIFFITDNENPFKNYLNSSFLIWKLGAKILVLITEPNEGDYFITTNLPCSEALLFMLIKTAE